MKGTLHKTESGWQVWYHAKDDLYYGNTGVRILPLLDHGYVNGPGLSDSDEGQEVEFEIIDFPSNSISKYAKLVDKATRPLTEDDAWITMNKETLEEAAKKYCLINNISTDQMIVKNDRSCEFETPITMFTHGAKWQEERMFKLVEEYNQMLIDSNVHDDHKEKSFKEWFEQFKKK